MDTHELDVLGRSLHAELEGLPLDSVEPSAAGAPARSKAAGGLDWTTLLVTLAASGGALTALIAAIQGWLTRTQASSVTLKLGDEELVITGAGPYSPEQQRAIDLWLARQQGGALSE
jgi:hypothetical protein